MALKQNLIDTARVVHYRVYKRNPLCPLYNWGTRPQKKRPKYTSKSITCVMCLAKGLP